MHKNAWTQSRLYLSDLQCTHRIEDDTGVLAFKADACLECSRVWPLVGAPTCANPRTGFKSLGTKSSLCGLKSSTLSQFNMWHGSDQMIFLKGHGHMN